MTEKLYYLDSYVKKFNAQVIACDKTDMGYAVMLDKTAFFPEGGGQAADTGTIEDAQVLDVQEKNGLIYHFTDSPVSVGSEVSCAIDWNKRFRRMQNHSGEHIVSGIVHGMFGFDNVGFHLGSALMTIDFNGVIDEQALRRVELLANEAVCKNVSVYSNFPDKKALQQIEYRSKKEIDGEIRLIYIDGYDICACCAPHVARTGEIGLIKIINSEKYKGGVRLSVLCGFDALDDVNIKYRNNAEISALLSSKADETADAVRRLLGEQQSDKRLIGTLKMQMADLTADALKKTDGNLCVFTDGFDFETLRRIVNRGVPLCGGVCAVFSGSDDKGYIYIIGSKGIDLRAASRDINAAIGGRGGGRPEMLQGSASAKRSDIEIFFQNFR